MGVVSVLDREMYTEAEAARLLRVPQATLHYWLDGGVYRKKPYRPILRLEPRGDRVVTWAEFVEAAMLREYRRTLGVPMAELRSFIDILRERYGTPYPLADRRPYVADRKLVLEAQSLAGLKAEFCLVAVVQGQLILTAPSRHLRATRLLGGGCSRRVPATRRSSVAGARRSRCPIRSSSDQRHQH